MEGCGMRRWREIPVDCVADDWAGDGDHALWYHHKRVRLRTGTCQVRGWGYVSDATARVWRRGWRGMEAGWCRGGWGDGEERWRVTACWPNLFKRQLPLEGNMLRPYEPKRDHRPVRIRPPEHIEPEAAAKGGVHAALGDPEKIRDREVGDAQGAGHLQRLKGEGRGGPSTSQRDVVKGCACRIAWRSIRYRVRHGCGALLIGTPGTSSGVRDGSRAQPSVVSPS